MKDILIVSTSPSDFEILKPLFVQLSKKSDTDLLCLFEPNKTEVKFAKNHRLNLVINNLNLTHKKDQSNDILKDLKKINNFISTFLLESPYKYFVILGDRYELLPIAQQVYLSKKILVHLHGGEITEDSWDDSIRHSISKLSHFHFVSSARSKKLLISMGEQSKNIFNYGSLGAQNAKKINLLDKSSLFEELKLNKNLKTCFLVFQPTTNSYFDVAKNMKIIEKFLFNNNFEQLLVSHVNSDPGSKEFISYLKEGGNNIKFEILSSLGIQKYLSMAKHVDLVIGNSSSFIFELPLKNIKSILITDRQKGREITDHVFRSKITLKDLQNTYDNLKITKTKIGSPYYKNNTDKYITNKIVGMLDSPPKFKKVFNYEK